MRVLPDFWHWTITSERAKRGNVSILPVLWANLTAEVITYLVPADISPELEFTAIESGAIAQSVVDMTKFSDETYSPNDSFFHSGFSLVGHPETNSAKFAADSALAIEPYMESYAADSNLYYNGIWNLLRSDISDIMSRYTNHRSALWQKERNPFLDRWSNVKKLLNDSKENWSFWIKWYEAALKGEILNQEMLEQIALISPKDWEQGPKRVNGLIAEIEEGFKGGATETDHPAAPSEIQKNKLVLRAVAEGVSAQVADVIERYFHETRQNELPEEFRALQELPELFASISQVDESSDYQVQIEKLKGKIKELEAGLKIAQSKSVNGTFSKAFLEQAGKSLGDWKMWGALGGAVYMFVGAPAQTGTTGIMDSVSNIVSSARGIFPMKP